MKKQLLTYSLLSMLLLIGCARTTDVSTSNSIFEGLMDIKYQHSIVAIGVGFSHDSSTAVDRALMDGERKLEKSYNSELSKLIASLIKEDPALSMNCLIDEAPLLQKEAMKTTGTRKVWRREGKYEINIPMYISISTLLSLFEIPCFPHIETAKESATYLDFYKRVVKENNSLGSTSTKEHR